MTSAISFGDANAMYGIQFEFTTGCVSVARRDRASRPCSMLDNNLLLPTATSSEGPI